MAATQSPAKLKIIEFVQTAVVDVPFKFNHSGTQRDAEKFVHRMRVELSRLREIVKQRQLVPRPFKLLIKSIEYSQAENLCTITLLKTVGANDVSEEVDNIFDALAGGKQIV